MGCWAATNRLGPAVAVISGLGSVVVAADRARGLWRRFGGWDFLLGDEGSGYSLGRAALQETLLVSEGRSGAEALSAAVLASKPAAAKHVTDAEDLPDAVHTPAIDKAWIASFAPLVLGLADSGDEHCLAIVRREIRILAGAAAALVVALGVEGGASTPVGVFGGTFNSPSLHAAFVDAVCSSPPVRSTRPCRPTRRSSVRTPWRWVPTRRSARRRSTPRPIALHRRCRHVPGRERAHSSAASASDPYTTYPTAIGVTDRSIIESNT